MSLEQRPEGNEEQTLTSSEGRVMLGEAQQESAPFGGQAAGMWECQRGGQSAGARVVWKQRRLQGSWQPGEHFGFGF